MSDEQNVTYVAGKAVEQSEDVESNLEDSEREAAVEAVRKAIKESEEAETEEKPKAKPKAAKEDKPEASAKDKESGSEKPRDATGRFVPSKPKEDAESKEEPEEEEELPDIGKASVKQLLKARERVAKAKAESQEVDARKAAFEAEQRAFHEQVRQFQEQQAQLAAQQKKLELLRSDPARAIREIGWEPEQFIVDLAKEGTPEGQMARAIREQQAQMAEIRAFQESQLRQAQAQAQQVEEYRRAQHRASVESEFLKHAFDEEKAPHTATFYKGQEEALFAFGDLVAREFRKLSGGREAELHEIAEFIEDHLAERAKTYYSKSKSGNQDKSDVKPKGSKGKSLTPEVSGERRALSRQNLKDLDDDDRIKLAAESVAAAIADSQ